MKMSEACLPSCTVVVCTRDRPVELERCLLSVEKCSYPNFDVLITDSAPKRYLASNIARRFGARYVKESRQGVGTARTRGALECKSEIIAYLDDDATAAPDWISKLACEFSDPDVGVVTGRILALSLATTTQQVCAELGMYDLGSSRIVLDRNRPSWLERASFGGFGLASNMALRRSVFRTWTGFDPRLGRGTRMHANEENYAFFQLVSQGYRAVYTPEAVVFHPVPETMEQLREEYLNDLAAQTAYLMMLVLEARGYRSQFLKYVSEAIYRTRRNWRHAESTANCRRAARISSLEAAKAVTRGISHYLLMKVLPP